MGMLAVRSYDLELLNRLVDVLGGDGNSVEFVVRVEKKNEKKIPSGRKRLTTSN